ncbi:MAG: response regulator transcription factor [Rhodospirillaceae bacterium]|nr:response regulator transcription factor [Rhodospirillaceae bacterium]
MRVLLIEDEPNLGQAVREHVAAEGHAVDWFQRLDEAEDALGAVDYELILLDLHLPDGRGLDLLRTLRRRGDATPVIILTARDQISDRIEGLNAGADDYLVKPFDLDELAARVAAVARRYAGNPNPLFRAGAVEVDRANRQVRVAGREVDLTAREWAVLEQLLRRPRAVVSKDRLEDALYAFGAEVASNAVEVYVSRLRKKLGPDLIRTLRGVGYRLEV